MNRVLLLFCFCLLAGSASAQTAYYSFEGNLNAVEDQHNFFFTLSQDVASPTPFGFETYSSGGGTNAAGDSVSPGGVDSVLELLTAAGDSRGSNDDGALRSGFDAYLTWAGLGLTDSGGAILLDPLPSENYRLNLSAFSNARVGPWAVDLLGPSNSITMTGAAPVGSSSIDSFKFGTTSPGVPGSAFTLSGATLDVGSEVVVAPTGDATLLVESVFNNLGTLTSSTGVIGELVGSNGSVNVRNLAASGLSTNWTLTNALTVGKAGTGALTVSAGGTVESVSSVIGEAAGSDGVVTVRDGAPTNSLLFSQFNMSAGLSIGVGGTGRLNVESGGSVTNVDGVVGQNAGAMGTVVLQGSANSGPSKWVNSGSLMVADSGSGTIEVRDGAMLSNLDSTLGNAAGAIGMVTVTGTDGGGNASDWGNGSSVVVGNNGTGVVTISAGGEGQIGNAVLGQGLTGSGTVLVTGANSRVRALSLTVADAGTGVLTVASGGEVVVNQTIMVGKNGTINVLEGGLARSGTVQLGTADGSNALARVDSSGATSTWAITGDLTIGSDVAADATVVIGAGGLVSVTGTTTLGSISRVSLEGGRFEFGQTTLAEYLKFSATSGSLAGTVPVSGFNDVSSFSQVGFGPAVDTTGIALLNSGRLVGGGTIEGGVINGASGELDVITGERMRFIGTTNSNEGQITLAGGSVEFTQAFTNQAGGLVIGDGVLRADAGTTNDGAMAFSATARVIGDLANNAAGLITSSGGTTTFFDDVTNSGEIRTNANSFTVYFGSYSGNGDTGTGTVIMEGDLKPGSSPGIMAFGGDLMLGNNADTEIELGGLVPGTEFDQITVADQLTLNGDLEVSLFGGFTPSIGDLFPIITSGGGLTGTFDSALFPALSGGLGFETIYGANSVELLVVPLNGDFDADGDVDVADALAGQRIGASLDAWRTNFGTGSSPLAMATTVPEPASLAFVVVGFSLALRFRW